MKRAVVVLFVMGLIFWAVPIVFSAEHGGATEATHEHGGTATGTQEHGGAMVVKTPSADDIRAAMKNYVDEKSKVTGTFDVSDPETGKTRKLILERVHERVGKTGNYYYSCADFKDTETSEKLDLDLDVEDKGGVLNVADVRIHKVNGQERYTYDASDNRIPVAIEPKVETHEHGGKEHGGN